jgi:hypothetical protein
MHDIGPPSPASAAVGVTGAKRSMFLTVGGRWIMSMQTMNCQPRDPSDDSFLKAWIFVSGKSGTKGRPGAAKWPVTL